MKTGTRLTQDSVIPEHIAIIMDGNGRWARAKGMPREAGHSVGAEVFRKITEHCCDMGVKILTVYAFSTENWKRSENEVSTIMKLFDNYLDNCIAKLSKLKVSVRFIGDRSRFSKSTVEKMDNVEKATDLPDRLILNIAVNYGARAELTSVVNLAASRGGTYSEEDVSKLLYTSGQRDPDLIIRTGGEYRLSNFLLWQSAYSEMWFTDVLWPDFKKSHLNSAINDYSGRKRRFGG
ncbi:MAG: polyprenyl diphosphate synthase [Eubacteriales bacterium]